MKKVFAFLLLFSIISVHSQKLEKSLLWKISGKSIEKPSYLFGTIHASCYATLDANTIKALEETAQLYLEIDMDDPNMQIEMINDMMMKDGIVMNQLVSKEDYDIVDVYFKKQTGHSLTMMNSIKPFFVSAMLIPQILGCEMQSLEKELVTVSETQKEGIYGLETINEQMVIFDEIPYQDQMEELVKSVRNNLVTDKKEYAELLTFYNNKDLDGLLELSKNSENKLTRDFEEILLTNRNKNWIPRIEKIIFEKPTFIGVGAAHLGGENGVIMLLRAQGYVVEPIL